MYIGYLEHRKGVTRFCLPVVAVYQMEILVEEREAFGFVAVLLQLETNVDCFVGCSCSGFANKYTNQMRNVRTTKRFYGDFVFGKICCSIQSVK